MSVFDDFQRLWMQRFPQSSLSDAWEQDVRASLERHKLKITELSKELEQETLYVEYLERLLSDVEKYRESGGDPSTLFEAAATASASSAPSSNGSVDKEIKSSLNLREASVSTGSSNASNKDKDRLSLNTDNKYNNNTHTKNASASGGGGGGLKSAPPTVKPSTELSFEHDYLKDKENEKDAGGQGVKG
ncbi:uncharacterized protein Dwil_GK28336 [Drosophila willistoni]|uniref:Bcr-Abl oncoprotein oligomerisation domain-containing protein n=1 Tax=Drosophila willistoni TaxID=7260 RepID=A0A0Q9WX76_DROWI|nr:uncharacterized protein Dwil_GK28336 [Drosophila willistoni]